MKRGLVLTSVLAMALAVTACEKKEKPANNADGATNNAATADGGTADTGIKTDKGVDATAKVIKIGTLNDESGPAAAIGKPYAVGKRLMAEVVNAGDSGLLPEGWKVELVERDHGYNPQKSVQAYNEIKDDVLYIGTSFGTPNTLPLLKMLERDTMVAQPASLSSKMAESKYTPPAGPAYYFEAMRALDFAVKNGGGADKIKVGIVYQQDDYGKDGIYGLEQAAEAAKVEVVSKQTIAAGQKDFAAAVTALKEAGATHVLLTVLPSATGPILGTAAQLKYMPVWIGNTPAWTDKFFSPDVIPSAVFANFYVVTGLPYWGEKVPGMDKFLEAHKKYGKDSAPDSYTLMSYVQGLQGLAAAKAAIEAGDITREGFVAELNKLDKFDAGGLIQPINLTKVPYVVSTKTRILKPDFEKKSWEVAGDFQDPSGYKAPAE